MFFAAFYITVMRLDRRPQGGGRGAASINFISHCSLLSLLLDFNSNQPIIDGAAFYISVIARVSGSEAELCLYR